MCINNLYICTFRQVTFGTYIYLAIVMQGKCDPQLQRGVFHHCYRCIPGLSVVINTLCEIREQLPPLVARDHQIRILIEALSSPICNINFWLHDVICAQSLGCGAWGTGMLDYRRSHMARDSKLGENGPGMG